ncbi:MAG: MoaD/ThiS family protein [Anaerolineae bacterium]
MSVTLIPVGMLKDYTGGQERLHLTAGPTVEALLERVGIPSELVAGVISDEELVSLAYRPEDGETLKVFTVMGGG